MLTDRHSGSDIRAFGPGGAGRMTPILARALELRRGPAGLVRWLADRPAGPGGSADVARLAAELNQVVRRAGVAETLVE